MPSDLDRWERAMEKAGDERLDQGGASDVVNDAMPPLLEIARLAAKKILHHDRYTFDEFTGYINRLDALLRKHTEVKDDG